MCYPYAKKGRIRIGMRSLAQLLLPVIMVAFSTLLATAVSAAQNGENAIVGIQVQNHASATTVQIQTKESVANRYTVYDSFDPLRVVVDFPGMDVSEVAKAMPVNEGPVQEVRVSSFDLTSGKLGRIELLLTTSAKYEVTLEGNTFQVHFDKAAAKKAEGAPVADSTPAKAGAPDSGKETVAATADGPAKVPAPAPTMAPGNEKTAHWLQSLQIDAGQAVLHNDGRIGNYQYFKLGSPPRLVIDLFGIQPQFQERSFPATNGFKQVRVGTYQDKTRLVFDAYGQVLPQFFVTPQDDDLIISWPVDTKAVAAIDPPKQKKAAKVAVADPVMARAVKIESVHFDVKDGQSLLSVALSGPAELIPATLKDNTVGFGIKHATISRSLRRTLDASAFPSAVKRVTPYTVLVGDSQDVRFAVELKGATDYSLKKEGTGVVLTIDNKGFAQPQAMPAVEVLPVPVPASSVAKTATKPAAHIEAPSASQAMATAEAGGTIVKEVPAANATSALEPQAPEEIIGAAPKVKYTGQKITLVFDDADILNILQLIAEVSNLNIVASDDVKGTITLRLVDVPWDQALALIMDIKDLGMVKQGNIVRIMPKEKLRAMEEARMNASRTREKLEDLETELITVNYAELGSVSKHVKEVLTKDRAGVSVSEDARNKQLIVRDIPSNLVKVKELIHKLDTPERQVMIEARIVEATSTFSRDLGVKWGFSSEAEHRDNELANNQTNVGLGGSFLISPPAAGSVLSSAGMGAGFTFGKIGSTSLDLRISALEASGQGKVISTPRISTLNGGQAKISQGTKIPYQSSGTEGAKTEFVDANLELTVTPVINPDNSMILDITATDSSIGSNVNTGLNTQAPAIDTREAKTKLLVRDGETTVIGGIFVESDTNSTSGVPWLMKLPLIGHLFDSTNKSNQRAELLIFITPHIVD
jgi:type IV pilus assembly protein PilQ